MYIFTEEQEVLLKEFYRDNWLFYKNNLNSYKDVSKKKRLHEAMAASLSPYCDVFTRIPFNDNCPDSCFTFHLLFTFIRRSFELRNLSPPCEISDSKISLLTFGDFWFHWKSFINVSLGLWLDRSIWGIFNINTNFIMACPSQTYPKVRHQWAAKTNQLAHSEIIQHAFFDIWQNYIDKYKLSSFRHVE